MTGADVKLWRQRTGYSQRELQLELGYRSRTSVSALENQATPIDRTVELALAALELAPLLRRQNFAKLHPSNNYYPAISERTARALYAGASTQRQLFQE